MSLARLRKFACYKDGKIKRGALARISENQGVTPNTVKYWLSGKFAVGKERMARIVAMIDAKIDLTPNYYRCGRKRKSARSAFVE